MNNKLLVIKRPGQTYYEIKLDQVDVPPYVTRNVAETIDVLLNPEYFIFWANKSVVFVDCAMFDALIENGSMPYKDQLIIL
jgi:hypothetical protein